ncbi:hypothetical protein PHMEG_00027371 [Phytophthora megakarya]|uniref:Helitron helicase n=1 Tax=Phytophthora megakarya TaxID=4795 RepID=A0A225V8Q7_9STRA|nr:hypothetical protein PHMEG_00027371 [Phytophthora megakarya]
MRARHDLFGLLKRFGPLHVFFTVFPDSSGTYNIAVKCGRISKQAIDDANTWLMPNRAKRKAVAAAHPVECTKYFLRVVDTIIEDVLGWNQNVHAPKRGGGIFGIVRAFGAAAETQVAGDLHAHLAVWLQGLPTTSIEYREFMETNPDFWGRFVRLVDRVLVTKPPCLADERQCPVCFAENSLKPVVPGIDAFRRPTHGTSPPVTSECNVCGVEFRDKGIIDHAVQSMADSQHVLVDVQSTDFEKCRPPSKDAFGDLATSLLVRDVQVHYWNHSKSCFKVSDPLWIYNVAKFIVIEIVDRPGLSIRLHRAIGCEYVNAYNPVVMATLKCNHDAQFVLNGSKDTAAYIAKYCFKNQNPVENHTALSLAAFANAAKKAQMLPPETTSMEVGYRILGSMLYSVTNGHEVAATMAALYILNESPFWFSHDFVHINLGKMLKKYEESVEISISQQAIEDEQSHFSNVPTKTLLQKYWKREGSLENLCFMEICEQYEFNRQTRNEESSPNCSDVALFSKLTCPKVFVLSGDEIPDISS